MQDVAHDVLSVFQLDSTAREEIGYVDWQAYQSSAAGITEKVPVLPLNFLYISGEESAHHGAKVMFVNREPFITYVERFACAVLLQLRLLIGCDDSPQKNRVVLFVSRMRDKVARHQIRAKVRVSCKSFFTCLNCA